MPTRKGHARWEGDLRAGAGTIDFAGGAFRAKYSFASRFEEGPGTNPEELIAAAHAGCFAQALSGVLAKAGLSPNYIDVTAHVTVEAKDGGFTITESKLVCEGRVPGIDATKFAQHAEQAKATCPVSRALAGVRITLDARLA